ncbi:MAG: PKD domain-containing protein, partial [Chloroflexi bacterium]
CTNCPNPVAIPQDTITYFLYGISLQGCENTDSILINVLPLPPVVASPDTTICYGDSVMLYAAGGTSVEWRPHIGLDNPFSYTPMASPPYTITYRVIVTDTNGCSSIDSVTVIVNRSIARFNEPRACIGDTVYFVDSSIVIGGNIIRWEWDFGDGDTSTEQNPAHYYNAIGYYNVTLTVYDDNGCQDDTTVVVHVSPLPLPDFIVPDPVCEDAPAQFADNSWSAAGLLSWWWDFGDGTYDSVENPVHIYTDTGFYTITMTVTDSNLCENSTSKTVYVRLRSFPNFEAENVCFHDTVYFRDISVSVPGIESWYWDFGDGQSDTVINPWHYYSAPGTYPATLTVTDSFGCAYDTTIPVTVFQLPAADFIAPRTCLGNTTQFMDITTPGDANLVDWQWSFGDSAMAAIQNPVHLYSDSGIYLVQLIVTDANTCKDTIVKALIIDHPPDAFAGPDTIVCSGNSIQLYGGGGDTVYWTPHQWLTDPTIRNPIATPEFSINYTLHTTNGVCPYDTAIVHLTVIQIPFVKTIDDTRILQGTPIELTTFASPYDSIVWYAFINDTLVTADSLLWLSCTHC